MKPLELSVKIANKTKNERLHLMDDHSAIGERVRDWIVATGDNPQSLSDMERKIRWGLYWLGNIILHLWLMSLTLRYPPAERVCPHCGERADYREKRPSKLHTMFGTVRYRRAYYLCVHCHQGHCPLDIQLGLRPNAMSAEVERLAALIGVQMPFGKGREVFEQLTLVSLSDHSLDKASQAYGTEIEQREQEQYVEALDTEALLRREREKPRPVRLYGAIDGGRVRTRPTEADDNPWRELKTGAWFIAKGQPPKNPNGKWTIQAQDISYYTDIGPADDFGKITWATGVQRDAHRAVELIFLGDGARWIWDLVTLHFPNAIQIVDWFHACEYLAPIAKAAFSSPEHRSQWIERVKTDLWQGNLDAVIAACAQQVDRFRDDDPAQKAVTYFTNNRHRMDYPTYRANGYQIGSGTIESAVKQIAAQRMKVPGARWDLQNARLVAKARAAFLSGQWDELAVRRERLSYCA